MQIDKTGTYQNLFENWKDVQDQFQMTESEPDEVFLAAYEYEDYSGQAYVFYRRGEDYFEVTGGHCSCYGLEGQWEPEKYDLKTLIGALTKRAEGKWADGEALFVLPLLLARAAGNDNAPADEAKAA